MYTRFVRLMSAVVACLWLGHSAVGLACAMACAPGALPVAASSSPASVHAVDHRHHAAMTVAEVSSPVPTPSGSVGVPSHHACNEATNLPARLGIPTDQHVETTARAKASVAELPLLRSRPVVSRIDRWHVDRALSPPGAVHLSFVLRI